MVFSPQVDIALISVAIATTSQFVQRKLMPREETRKRQEKIKKHQDRMKQLADKKDAKSKNELEALEKEMMNEMGVMMQGSTRMMMFSMLFVVPMFWFLGAHFKDVVVQLPFPFPWFAANWAIKFYTETTWVGWYVLCSLVTSLVINAAMNLREQFAKKGAEAQGKRKMK